MSDQRHSESPSPDIAAPLTESEPIPQPRADEVQSLRSAETLPPPVACKTSSPPSIDAQSLLSAKTILPATGLEHDAAVITEPPASNLAPAAASSAAGTPAPPLAEDRRNRRNRGNRGSRGNRDNGLNSGNAQPLPNACTQPPASADAVPQPGDTVGHYELIRELGRGGMGVVYLARDLKLARRVAIKFIVTSARGLTELFIDEARITARCHHEHIVVIHDIGDHAGHPYMVLEYLEGRNLRQAITQPMAPERAIEVMLPVARALERAHRHGIIHRDLKPENIFVTDSGSVKVLDFGIAKALTLHESLTPLTNASSVDALGAGNSASESPRQFATQANALVGTLPYMAPEQLMGKPDIDPRSDLWAAGIILFELLLGRHPLAPLNPMVLNRVTYLDEPMPAVAELAPHAGKLGALIDRCLIKHRDHRLATAAELVADLEALAPRRSVAVLSAGESPFHGLAAFQARDADRFFGRNRDIHNVVTQLQSQPLVTIAGPSGTGKSSLVRAGVIPALERSGEGWCGLVIRPGRDPLTALTSALEELRIHQTAGNSARTATTAGIGNDGDPRADAAQLAARLREEPGLFGRDLRTWARNRRRRLILFVDQFEELYTLAADDEAREVFARCLQGVADDASSPLRVIISVRSDFLDRLVEGERFSGQLARGLVLLPPMGRDGLCAALTQPVAAAGYHFEDQALIDDMLDALAGTPGALPLLQFAASKLWDGRDRTGKRLTRACYDGFGGVAGALAAHGDAVLAGMSTAQLTVAKAIFERLVTPERTRAVVTLRELRELPGEADAVEQVVHHLADARLITIEQGSDGPHTQAAARALARPGKDDHGDRDKGRQSEECRAADACTVELIHESLITRWPTLQHWLDDGHEDAEFMARLRTAAQQWHDGGRRDGLLWRGEAAAEAQRWAGRGRATLTASERHYLDAVIAHLGRTARIKRYAVGGIIAFLTISLVLATLGLFRILDAEERVRRRAEQLERSWHRETAAKRQAEEAQSQAELAQQRAEAAQAAAERSATRAREEAENTRKALDEARAARAQADASASQAKQSAKQARMAQAQADAERSAADEAKQRALAEKDRAEKERARAEEEADKNQTLIDRAVGPLEQELPP